MLGVWRSAVCLADNRVRWMLVVKFTQLWFFVFKLKQRVHVCSMAMRRSPTFQLGTGCEMSTVVVGSNCSSNPLHRCQRWPRPSLWCQVIHEGRNGLHSCSWYETAFIRTCKRVRSVTMLLEQTKKQKPPRCASWISDSSALNHWLSEWVTVAPWGLMKWFHHVPFPV